MNTDSSIVLPISGYTVFFHESITYGQHRALEDIIKKGLTTAVSPDGKTASPTVSGEALAEHSYKTLLAWVASITDKKHEKLTNISSVIDGLPAEDGKLIEERIVDISVSVKKK